MCCLIPATPVDSKGEDHWHIKKSVYGDDHDQFQIFMLNAPCHSCCSCLWFLGQCNPYTCGITQFLLRLKYLKWDIKKYSCCQGYCDSCCCIPMIKDWVAACPFCCLCLEAHLCNGLAISSTRMAVQDQYDLRTDPCEYRMIRISNCIQMISCIIDVLAIFDNSLREVSKIIDIIADIVYHTISGCMTAQVSIELDYRYGPNYVESSKKREEEGDDIDNIYKGAAVTAEPYEPGKHMKRHVSANVTGDDSNNNENIKKNKIKKSKAKGKRKDAETIYDDNAV